MRRFLITFFILLVFAAVVYVFVGFLPTRAMIMYGAPASHLDVLQRVEYSTRLFFYGDALYAPLDPNGAEQTFTVESGESAFSVATRLQQAGLISDAQAFMDYLVYSGLDLTLQSGAYALSPKLSIIEIARAMQDATPTEVTFTILSGWRMEEIAAAISSTGLDIYPEDFLRAAQNPPAALDFIPGGSSMEGFFFPYSYTVPRDATTYQLLDLVARNFVQHISDEMKAGFEARGLNIYQAATLASVIEREAVKADEMPLIASVFYNRMAIGMNLGSDPTVQYALGYDYINQTWWKNPLTLDDLKIDSPYNTYVYTGLPPAPISNPSLEALRAVAFPQESPYYFFQAKCDHSGYHNFAVTFEEHMANGCR